MFRRAGFIGVLLLIVVFTFPVLLGSDRIERSFEVADGGRLTIRAERGSIEVMSGDTGGVNIEILLNGWDREGFEDEFDVSFRQQENDVELEIVSRKRFSSWFNWGRKRFLIRAEVPTIYNVDLKTSGGGISVDDLEGEVLSRTSGGSLTFGRIEGPVVGETSGGSIKLRECRGEVDIETSGGSILIGDVEGDVRAVTSGGSINMARTKGNVTVKTSGGSIEIEDVLGRLEARTSGGSVHARLSSQPDGDCLLTTSGGGVTVYLAPDLAFDLNAATSSGRVKIDSALGFQGEAGKRKAEGRLNGGGQELYLRTSGGNVEIRTMH